MSRPPGFHLSRRGFLRLTAAGAPLLAAPSGIFPLPSDKPLGRVAVRTTDARKTPDFTSASVKTFRKDTILEILETVEGDAPAGNPRWHHVAEGYVHSGDLQPVEYHPQIASLDITGTVPAEVSVPITQTYRSLAPAEELVYRLYYKSIHWVTGYKLGDDDRIWYTLHDQQLGVDLYVPGEHLRLIDASEYAPIHTDVPADKKWIDVHIAAQTMEAYEDTTVVLKTSMSSGMGGGGNADYATPTGTFHIQNKIAGMHMGDGRLTADPLAYELPGVPWVQIFEPEKGVALHGTFWHDDFGRERSHGCVNLSPADALWLYRWTNPAAPEASPRGKIGLGTQVFIH